jgi:hypothetical protein
VRVKLDSGIRGFRYCLGNERRGPSVRGGLAEQLRRSRSGLDESATDRVSRELDAVAHAEPREDVRAVPPDRSSG